MRAKDTAGILAYHTYETLARTVVVFIDEMRDENTPLTQLQQIALVKNAIACGDGVREDMRTSLEADRLLAGLFLERRNEEAE